MDTDASSLSLAYFFFVLSESGQFSNFQDTVGIECRASSDCSLSLFCENRTAGDDGYTDDAQCSFGVIWRDVFVQSGVLGQNIAGTRCPSLSSLLRLCTIDGII